MHVYVLYSIYMRLNTSRDNPPRTQLQAVVSHLPWVLETKPRSSGRAVCAVNQRQAFLQTCNMLCQAFLSAFLHARNSLSSAFLGLQQVISGKPVYL